MSALMSKTCASQGISVRNAPKTFVHSKRNVRSTCVSLGLQSNTVYVDVLLMVDLRCLPVKFVKPSYRTKGGLDFLIALLQSNHTCICCI